MSISPPGSEALIVGGPPWRWRAHLAINFTSSEPVARDPRISASVKVRIEDANGRVLAQLSEEPRRVETRDGYLQAQFSETIFYEKAEDPPSKSRVVVEGHLSNGQGQSEDLPYAFVIQEELCGSKGTPSCGGEDISVGRGGVDPPSITVRFGQYVYFVSSDGRAHKISPDPAGVRCPALDLPEFKSRQPSGSFLTPGTTCRYIDEDSRGVKGEIVVLPIGVPN
jgi:hypothetical protein